MPDDPKLNALKHGAFSEIVILPGEDPAEYEKLKAGLFAEYKPSGPSQETTLTSIARAHWQERRFAIYQRVHAMRHSPASRKREWDSGPMLDAIAAWSEASAKYGGSPVPANPVIPTPPAPPVKKTDDEVLLDLGDIVSLEYFDRELDVENKLQSKLDRLYKRYFQMKAMESLMRAEKSAAPALTNDTPVLELVATDATISAQLPGDPPVVEQTAAELAKAEGEKVA